MNDWILAITFVLIVVLAVLAAAKAVNRKDRRDAHRRNHVSYPSRARDRRRGSG